MWGRMDKKDFSDSETFTSEDSLKLKPISLANFDDVYDIIGHFGRYQKMCCILLAMLSSNLDL